ncbi:hypothetical protein ACVWY5_006428 [Bradyrhizobium sp. USDA 3256]
MRYELSDEEWTAIRPMLPNKPRGVPRANDRRVLNGIFWCYDPGRHGSIYQTPLAHIPLATIALRIPLDVARHSEMISPTFPI